MKTSDLIGRALDYAVAKCEGASNFRFDTVATYWIDIDGEPKALSAGWAPSQSYRPSTDWSQGGPIIEREDISFRKYHNPNNESNGKCYARVCRESGTLVGWYKTTGFQRTGPTPLIAAMRCYVASELGDEVEIPDELK